MKVGIQLFSVKNYMQKDALGTIRDVVDMGYRYLEGANHMADKDFGVGFGVQADDLRKVQAETGGQVISCHCMPLTMDNIDAIIDYQGKIGAKFIVDPAAFFETKDDVLRKAETCNKLGEKCKAAGMEFLYHNHFHEFFAIDGETVFDIFMANTQKDLVGLELDTFWVMRAGVDPIQIMKDHGQRIRLVHQKDFAKGKEEQINVLAKMQAAGKPITMESFMAIHDTSVFTEIGTGIMDIQAIIDAANTHCKCDYIILEQDATALDEMESIKISMEQFKKFKGIEW